MIEYKIISNAGTNPTSSIKPINPGDDGFKDLVLDRALKNCFYRVGSRVKIRGTSKRGEILEIIKDRDRISWVRNRPNYIKVKFDSGEIALLNPCQIKRSKS